MASGYLPKNDYLRLKTSFSDLVAQSGSGRILARELGRARHQVFSEWGSKSMMERFPPLDVVADLEAKCGAPVMTETLADLSGYLLVEMPKADPTIDGLSLADIARKTGELIAEIADALADGEVTPDEARKLRKINRECLSMLAAIGIALDVLASGAGDHE